MRVPSLLFLAVALSPCSWAQLQVGTWSGTWSNPTGNNRQERPVSIEVKMTADPHMRWRSSPREVMDGTFVGANPGIRAQIGDVSLNEHTLSFKFLMSDDTVKCALTLNAEGAYAGDCKTAGGFQRKVTLSPPEHPPNSEDNP